MKKKYLKDKTIDRVKGKSKEVKCIKFYYDSLRFPRHGHNNSQLKLQAEELRRRLDQFLLNKIIIVFNISDVHKIPSYQLEDLEEYIIECYGISETLHNEIKNVALKIQELRFELNYTQIECRQDGEESFKKEKEHEGNRDYLPTELYIEINNLVTSTTNCTS